MVSVWLLLPFNLFLSDAALHSGGKNEERRAVLLLADLVIQETAYPPLQALATLVTLKSLMGSPLLAAPCILYHWVLLADMPSPLLKALRFF